MICLVILGYVGLMKKHRQAGPCNLPPSFHLKTFSGRSKSAESKNWLIYLYGG